MPKLSAIILSTVMFGIGLFAGAIWQCGRDRHLPDPCQTIIIRSDPSLPYAAEGVIEHGGVAVFTFRDAADAGRAGADAYQAAAERFAVACGAPEPSRR